VEKRIEEIFKKLMQELMVLSKQIHDTKKEINEKINDLKKEV